MWREGSPPGPKQSGTSGFDFMCVPRLLAEHTPETLRHVSGRTEAPGCAAAPQPMSRSGAWHGTASAVRQQRSQPVRAATHRRAKRKRRRHDAARLAGSRGYLSALRTHTKFAMTHNPYGVWRTVSGSGGI